MGDIVQEEIDFRAFRMVSLKVQGDVTINKPVISIIYIVSHTWPLCSARIFTEV